MSRFWRIGLLLMALPAFAAAQEFSLQRDFLTDHEVEQIRAAQDPNDRVPLYLHFAKLRIELISQILADEKPGRSVGLHRNLEEYGQIVETIDIIIDDALADELDVSEIMQTIVDEEQAFLTRLRAIEDKPAADHHRYEFVLEDSIEITVDSIELAQEDLGVRASDVRAGDQRERKKRDASMTPERLGQVTAVKKREADKEAKEEAKRPSLLRPGEKVRP